MRSNQATHVINGREFLFVQVPKETYKCVVEKEQLIIMKGYDFYQEWDYKNLPPGSWKLIGTSEIMSKDDAYLIDEARSLGLDPVNNTICILEKEK